MVKIPGARSIWFDREEEYRIEKFCRENNLMKNGKPEFSRAIRIMVSLAHKQDTIEASQLRKAIERYKEELFKTQEEIIKLQIQLHQEASKPLIDE